VHDTTLEFTAGSLKNLNLFAIMSNVYDSAYVVLAQFLHTTLWTADETLLNALGTAVPWVRSISAYPLP
jgi:predicted nucleic acid-binding protein